MATTREQIEQLQKQVRQLKIESAEMRRVLREHGLLPGNGKHTSHKGKPAISERERVLEILRRGGALAELTPQEKTMAAEWDALVEKRKQHVIQKLRTTRFDPPLSQTIIQDRG